LLLQLLKQSRYAGRSPPDRQVDERLARLERLEAWFAEQEWDHETQGWFRRKQKRRRKSATPVVNVYNAPRLWTGVGPKRKTEAPLQAGKRDEPASRAGEKLTANGETCDI
jgi:hypothetical protein